jgi:predicted small secreted protein
MIRLFKSIIIILLLLSFLLFTACTTPGVGNNAPYITNLAANPTTIEINQTTTLTCTAYDSDGDTLTYTWNKDTTEEEEEDEEEEDEPPEDERILPSAFKAPGTISGSGKTVAWTAPDIPGTYEINCVVSDGRGGKDSKTVKITVGLEIVDIVHNLSKDIYYHTIQAALNAADSNNIIEVANGTYDEIIRFPSGKKIILQSINGPSLTIIRGNDDLDTVTFSASLTGTTMEGFTITHTGGLIGRGIFVYNGNLTINNCVISDNSAQWGSGIGICDNSTVTITGSIISGNSAVSGGGIYNYTGSTLTIYGSTISDNSVSEWGGGIDNCDNSTLTIYGSTISGNSAGYNGGGIFIGLNSGTISIGGDSANKKNTICGNYKNGDSFSLNQQIRDDYGSLYYTYKDTNFISAYCE